jgi:5'-3' exonuclease
MGIRYLNRYLKQNCPESIRCIHMSSINGKKIAVDISIYLYKYESDNILLENIYQMLSIFRHYNIIPIFIFDGKPPPEKKALLIKRKEDRELAQIEYNKLKVQLDNKNDEDDKQEIIASMDQLKKQIVQISKDKIEMVKRLIRAYGATYFDAPGEADELCASLVIKKQVWACLSEDMDLFVYGCTRVLRYFSLVSHTAVLYYMKGILEELDMTQKEFKEICVLSGTDYNIHANGNNNKITLQSTIKYFKKYKQSIKSDNDKTDNDKTDKNNELLYDWLIENTNYISDIDLLTKINRMFDLSCDHYKLDVFKQIKIINGPIIYDDIKNIMRDDGFFFVN